MSASQPIPLKRYDADLNPAADNAHVRVMQLVGREKRVLELGCATGYMSRALTNEFGCVVTGVEVNPAAADEARPACARVIVGDLDAIDWHDALGAEQFDVVVAADVLEHLRNPARVLAAVRAHVAPGGYLVASIPNVAHTAVLAELLQGRFTYQPYGLLDDTHIRFFTRDSIYECFEKAGFVVTHLDRLTLEPSETEFRTNLSSFPGEVVNWLAAREDATTYQFILTAQPSASPVTVEDLAWPRSASGAADAAYRSVLERLAAQPAGSAVEGMLRAHAARVAFLEDTRGHQAEIIRRLQETLAKREQYIGAVTAESQDRQQEISKGKTYVASLLEEIDKLRAELTAAGDYASDLRQALEASERPLLEVHQRMGEALALHASQRAEIDELRGALRSAFDDATQLRQALEASGRRLLQERQRLGDAVELARNRSASERESERVRVTQSLEEERARLAEALDEARSRLADALDEARSRLAAGQEEQARAAREREHLEQVIASMKTAIETLERSRSWRLTAPLRAAARIFARPRDPR